MSNEVIKCLLLDEPEKTGLRHKFVLEYLDGTPVPEEEIDIGQKPYPYKYPESKKKFTWKFLNRSNDIAIDLLIAGAQASMNSIQIITGLDIDFERDPNKKADITKEFFNTSEDLQRVFGGRSGVLAQAYLYAPNSSFNGVQQYNDFSHVFTILGWPIRMLNGNARATQPFMEIDMHETGHTFGFRHDLLERASMLFPYVSPGYRFDGTQWSVVKESFAWLHKDIERWHRGYGTGGVSERHRIRWHNWRIGKFSPDVVPVEAA